MGWTTATAVARFEGKGVDTTRSMDYGMPSGGFSVHIQHFISGVGVVLGVAFIFMMKYVEFASIEANAINFMMKL